MDQFKPRLALFLCLIGLSLWGCFELYTGNALEDALITFRYAENLSQGNGYAFVPNEWVQGTTTPLFTLLLTFFGLVFGPEAIWPSADVINFFLGGGAAYLTALIVWNWTGRPTFAYASIPLMLFNPSFLWAGTGGMETTLVVFWMALSSHFFLKKQYLSTAIVAALLVLTRIDGLVWSGLLFLAVAKKKPRVALIGAGMGAGLVLSWFIWAWSVFGSPLPHSVMAKSIIRPLALQGSIFELHHILKWSKSTILQWSAISAGVPVGIFAFGFGVRRLWQSKRTLQFVFLVYAIAFPFLFFVRKAPFFAWYMVPLCWVGLLIGLTGLVDIKDKWQHIRMGPVLGGLLLICFVFRIVPKFQEFKMLQENEESLRATVGKWIEANTLESSRVAMEAIGYQGYYANRHVIDIAGLISPEVLKLVDAPYRGGVVFQRILKEIRPEYIVLRAAEVEKNEHLHGGPLFPNSEDRAYFEHYYQMEKSVEAKHKSFWGKNAVLNVYKRQILQ